MNAQRIRKCRNRKTANQREKQRQKDAKRMRDYRDSLTQKQKAFQKQKDNQRKNKFICDICNKHFAKKSSLIKHKGHHARLNQRCTSSKEKNEPQTDHFDDSDAEIFQIPTLTRAERLRQRNQRKELLAKKEQQTVKEECRSWYITAGDVNAEEIKQETLDVGCPDQISEHCGALFWKRERKTMCCENGKVKLDSIPSPPSFLKQLFEGTDSKVNCSNPTLLNLTMPWQCLQPE